MIVSGLSIWWVLLWATSATIFYRIRYSKIPMFKNPWTMIGIFVVNFFLFAWAAVAFVAIEWVRWSSKN